MTYKEQPIPKPARVSLFFLTLLANILILAMTVALSAYASFKNRKPIWLGFSPIWGEWK